MEKNFVNAPAPASAMVAPPETCAEATVNGPQPGSDPRVLVVDDQAVNRRVLEGQLQTLGFGCTLAGSGQEALDLMADQPFDLVITDFFMPSMDGLELTRRLRALEAAGRPRSVVLILTANATEGTAASCSEAGADGYITKPLRLESLAQTLRHWTGEAAEMPPLPEVAKATGKKATALIDDGSLAGFLGSDDPQLLARMTEEFLAAWETALHTLGQLLGRREAAELAEAAHAAKGLAQYSASSQLAGLCDRLETSARSRLWEQAAESLHSLHHETSRLQRHLTTTA